MLRFLLLLAVATASAVATRDPPAPPCYGVALYECLPGLEFIGVGFDAVVGSSQGVGRQVVNFTFANAGANTYKDPFGNVTVYNYPDQAHVSPRRAGDAEYHVFRSVNDYVSYQSMNANAHLKVGPWFSASVDTQKASKVMKDGLNIISETTLEIGVFDITLDPALQLTASDKFASYVAQLPEQYDPATYRQFVNDWGTHYIDYATLGGRATMSTNVQQEYFSSHTDFEIQAQLSIQWGIFGGGGGGGTSSNTTSSDFSSNSQSRVNSIGGDPAVRHFNSDADWSKWATSVETTSPVVTSYNVEMLHLLVADAKRSANVLQAITEYAAAHNVTFPEANLTTVKMGWCDCYYELTNHVKMPDPNNPPRCPDPSNLPYADPESCLFVNPENYNDHSEFVTTACKEGFMATRFQSMIWGTYLDVTKNWDSAGLQCCRPCFTASN